MTQTLDNLRRDGTLDIINYLERIPDRLIPQKQDLIDALKEKMVEQEAQEAAMARNEEADMAEPPRDAPGHARKPGGPPTVGGAVDPAKLIGNMPARMEAMYNELPARAQQAVADTQQSKA